MGIAFFKGYPGCLITGTKGVGKSYFSVFLLKMARRLHQVVQEAKADVSPDKGRRKPRKQLGRYVLYTDDCKLIHVFKDGQHEEELAVDIRGAIGHFNNLDAILIIDAPIS